MNRVFQNTWGLSDNFKIVQDVCKIHSKIWAYLKPTHTKLTKYSKSGTFKMWSWKTVEITRFCPSFISSKIIQIFNTSPSFLSFVDGRKLERSKFDFNDALSSLNSMFIETLCTWSEKLVFTHLFHPREYINSIQRSVTLWRLQIKTRSSTFPQFYAGISR